MAQSSQRDFQKKSSPSPVTTPSQAMAPRPFAPQVDVATPDVSTPNLAAPNALTLDSAPAFPKLNFQIRAAGGSPPPLQPKLTIGAPNDKYEQEADRVAAQVVQRIHSPATNLSTQNRTYQAQSVHRQAWPEQPVLKMKSTLQRETLPDEEDELQMKPMLQRLEISEDDELQMKPMPQRSAMPPGVKLQMKSAFSEGVVEGDASSDLESGIQQARGNGQALAPTLQMQMGQAMGADFSGVRVHTDTQSDQLNRSIQAKAFTTGQDIFFKQGAYEPGSRGGQELIAHELTHVIQQKGRQSIALEVQAWTEEAKTDYLSVGQNILQRNGGRAEDKTKGKTGVSPSPEKPLVQLPPVNLLRPALHKTLSPFPLFLKESFAGLLGYTSHYFMPPKIPASAVAQMSESRQVFHRGLIQLYSERLVPRWAHQLMWQNYMQSQFGGELPMLAATHMLEHLRNMGEAASRRSSRIELARHYDAFQRLSIPLFELGGSSYAPRILHTLGMLIQTPPIVILGHRWVNRPAQQAVLRGPVGFAVPVAIALGYFLRQKYWTTSDSGSK